jgi:preprotein translocase subunit SecF
MKKKETVTATKKQSFYDSNYKKLIIIPMALLLIAIVLITMKVINTGEFMNRGITLSGGISITVLTENIDKEVLLSDLQQEFPQYQMNIRGIDEAGRRIGVLIETNMPPENTDEVNRFNEIIKQRTNATDDEISTETMGSSLGAAFFQQTMIALILAFLFMGVVIFLYFKMVVPSALTILSALSDIIITLAIVNVLGLNIGTAGIAAFLMLIGYSVDANIVLNMRVLKRTSGTIKSQIKSAFDTGLTMSVTTLTAITVAFFIVDSPVLREIMIIMIIGLIVDVLNTWVQNAGLLRWYLERKETVKTK